MRSLVFALVVTPSPDLWVRGDVTAGQVRQGPGLGVDAILAGKAQIPEKNNTKITFFCKPPFSLIILTVSYFVFTS